MASGLNVEMGVSGISQFKRDINTAKSSLKTLDTQLELVEKQYKATGDKEAYMLEKTELLKAKLKNQKDLINDTQKALNSMAEHGIDRSSKAYQDLYQEMVKTKGKITT